MMKTKSIFETKSSNENFYNKEFGKSTRPCFNKPYFAYNAKDWVQYISNLYYLINNKKYENYPVLIHKESLIINRYMYPLVFGELSWSATDFMNFLYEYLQQFKKKKKDFFIPFLKTDLSEKKIRSFDRRSVKNKRKIKEIDKTYKIPHRPLSDNDDLIYVLSVNDYSDMQILTNFGLSIFCKYCSIVDNLNLEKAKEKTRKKVFSEIIIPYKNDKKALIFLLSSMFENSILSEPYTKEDHYKGIDVRDNKFLNWRKEFDDICSLYGLKDQDWWKTEDFMNNYYPIKHVENFIKNDWPI